MSKKIQKSNKSLEEVYIGKLYIGSDGQYFRVSKIKDGEVYLEARWSNDDWTSYGKLSEKSGLISVNSIEETEELAANVLANLHQFREEEEQENSNTEIVLSGGPEQAQRAIEAIEEKKRLVQIARAVMEGKISQVKSIVWDMEKKITQFRKVVAVFELYLGINEEIVQIQDGNSAAGDTPISIRQLVLFMDEEVGDPRPNPKTGQRGIDWQSIEEFDSWIINHLEQVLPEERGIVAVKPSRQNRRYSDNPWFDAILKAKNNLTYLLIRNGEKIFRIFAPTDIDEYLYPTSDETEGIQKLIDSGYHFELERGKDKRYNYVRTTMMLQGLLDRTEILEPFPKGRVNLFKPETYGDIVDLIRDGEFTLSDGRPSFDSWRKKINSRLQPGSRIYLSIGIERASTGWFSSKDYKSRFVIYYLEFNIPPLPKEGVYQLSFTDSPVRVYKGIKEVAERALRVMYNPKDEVGTSSWIWDPHTRKNRISFCVFADDKFLINVDQVSTEDIDYYLQSRLHRRNFIWAIPLLWGIRDFVEAEREKEIHFVSLVANRLGVEEKKVWKAVSWWKFKNKWKRSISDDDPKALRMIERKIKGQEEE